MFIAPTEVQFQLVLIFNYEGFLRPKICPILSDQDSFFNIFGINPESVLKHFFLFKATLNRGPH